MLYARWLRLSTCNGPAARLRRALAAARRRWAGRGGRSGLSCRRGCRGGAPLPPWRLNTAGAALIGLAATVGGCGPASSYIAADRATYEAVAPEYAGYVDADPTLSDVQKQRRHRTADSWLLRIRQAEGAGGSEMLKAE
jgi:hypothetical protein